MLAYLGDHQLKADLVEEIQRHRAADMITKGTYGVQNGHWRGCAIGCSIRSLNLLRGLTLETNDHRSLSDNIGVPLILIRLEDSIFEGLPENRYLTWPEQFAAAVNVGADLSMVWPQFALWLLTDSKLLRITDNNRSSIEGVATLYKRWIDGAKPEQAEWIAARRTAADAAAYAASYAAAYAASYAASYAAAYADAAADAAAYAASYADADAYADAASYAAADAAAYADADAADAWRVARSLAWSQMADKLLSLIGNSQPVAEATA